MVIELKIFFVRLKKLFRHPSLVFYIHQDQISLSKQHMLIELPTAELIYRRCLEEIEAKGYSDYLDIVTTIHRHFITKTCYRNSFLYGVVRWFGPNVVLETGVHFGASSAFILSALAFNGRGKLHSIDLPNASYVTADGRIHSDPLPVGAEPGFVVPLNLRDQWKLTLGDVKDMLPLVLQQIPRVDLFFHDSAHTYDVMRFEYETIWTKLAREGLLLSDNVECNSAFLDFCKSKKLRHKVIRDIGVCVKV